MTLPKEQNKSSITYSKEMEIYEWPDKKNKNNHLKEAQ